MTNPLFHPKKNGAGDYFIPTFHGTPSHSKVIDLPGKSHWVAGKYQAFKQLSLSFCMFSPPSACRSFRFVHQKLRCLAKKTPNWSKNLTMIPWFLRTNCSLRHISKKHLQSHLLNSSHNLLFFRQQHRAFFTTLWPRSTEEISAVDLPWSAEINMPLQNYRGVCFAERLNTNSREGAAKRTQSNQNRSKFMLREGGCHYSSCNQTFSHTPFNWLKGNTWTGLRSG